MNTTIENYIAPRVNVLEDNVGILIEAEMPGVSKDDTKIEVRDGQLTIEAQRPPNGHSGSYRLRERPTTGYYRVFRLGETIDTEHIDAELVDGVLRVSLRKQARFQPRTISVN